MLAPVNFRPPLLPPELVPPLSVDGPAVVGPPSLDRPLPLLPLGPSGPEGMALVPPNLDRVLVKVPMVVLMLVRDVLRPLVIAPMLVSVPVNGV